MNSRERLQTTLNHKEPDRIPFDLGGTIVTGIHIDAYQRLREYLGFPKVKDIKILDIIQQIAVIDEDVRQFFGADVYDVIPQPASTFNREINEMDDYTYFYDEWGIGWRKPKDGGLYYDMFYHPMKDISSVEEVDRYPWPNPTDPARFAGLREQAQEAVEVKVKAAVLSVICSGPMEISCWMRGFEEFYSDIIFNEKLLTSIIDWFVELRMAYWEKALAEVGEYVDVIFETDDLGAQLGMLISPSAYRKIIKPRHKRLFDFIHSHTKAKILLHSCGSIRPIIPDLIEIGVDILNPVQVSARDMDSAELKKEFGKDLVFWGGGVDTQYVLGSGTPQQVKDEVRRRIDDLAPGGGFVFATVHNIQANVPPQNIIAMWEAVREFGNY